MTDNRLRIGFMGTPDFAVPALKALHDSGHEIVCLYTQPPRPKGRGHKVQQSPTHLYAERKNIPVFHPKSLKSKDEQAIFAAHNLDVAIVAAYGLILPKAVLDAPKYGCINIHASLLPRWRGASPIQHAIWQGDDKSGVTLMQMDEGLDTGPEISKRSLPIEIGTPAQSLHDDLSILGAQMVEETINRLAGIRKKLPSTPQDDSNSTYAPLLKKEDGHIDWSQTAPQIDRQLRALNPWPGTYTGEGDKRLKILAGALGLNPDYTEEQPGTLIDRFGHIACGKNTVLQILTLQPAGKKQMSFGEALNGGYIKIGDRLT